MKHIILLIFLFSSILQAGNKIVYLISPPRCLSTALLRMFQARTDFVIVNEPGWGPYNLTLYPYEKFKIPNETGSWIFYSDVLQMVFEKAKTSHVLIKEISFAVEPFLLDAKQFMCNPDVYFIFLIRDPHSALISFCKKRFKNVPLQKFGYRSSYLLFEQVKQYGANSPIIISAEELSRYPEEIIAILCEKIGIPFKPESLHWVDLGENFEGKEWNDRKDQKYLYHWHNDAIHSTGFRPLVSYALNAQGEPTFEEVGRENLPEVVTIYKLMLPYYWLLFNENNFKITIHKRY